MPTLRAPDDAPTLPILTADEVVADAPRRRLPAWLKRPIPASRGTYFTKDLIGELGLETICESGRCPNRSECWTPRTRHVHDPGRDLHPPLRLLRREAGQARGRGAR